MLRAALLLVSASNAVTPGRRAETSHDRVSRRVALASPAARLPSSRRPARTSGGPDGRAGRSAGRPFGASVRAKPRADIGDLRGFGIVWAPAGFGRQHCSPFRLAFLGAFLDMPPNGCRIRDCPTRRASHRSPRCSAVAGRHVAVTCGCSRWARRIGGRSVQSGHRADQWSAGAAGPFLARHYHPARRPPVSGRRKTRFPQAARCGRCRARWARVRASAWPRGRRDGPGADSRDAPRGAVPGSAPNPAGTQGPPGPSLAGGGSRTSRMFGDRARRVRGERRRGQHRGADPTGRAGRPSPMFGTTVGRSMAPVRSPAS